MSTVKPNTSKTPQLNKASILQKVHSRSNSKSSSKRNSEKYASVNMYTINNGNNITIEGDHLNKMIEATNSVIDTLSVTTCEAAAEACEAAAESAENASKSAMRVAGRMIKKYKNNEDEIKKSQIQMAEVIAEAAVATATAAKLGAKVCRIGNRAMSQDMSKEILKVSQDEDTEEILKRSVTEYVSEDTDDDMVPLNESVTKIKKRKNSTPCGITVNELKHHDDLKRPLSTEIQERNYAEFKENVDSLLADVKDKIDDLFEKKIKPITKQINDDMFTAGANVKDEIDNLTENTITNIEEVNKTIQEQIIPSKKRGKHRGITDITALIGDAIEEFEMNIEDTKNNTLETISKLKDEFILDITQKRDELLKSFDELSDEHISKVTEEFKNNITILTNALQHTIELYRKDINYLIDNLNDTLSESRDGIKIMKAEIERMLNELDEGAIKFDNKIATMKEQYINQLNTYSNSKYIETIELLQNTIKNELNDVDFQLNSKFGDFNAVLNSMIETVHANEITKLNEDINRISNEFRNVTNIDVILKQVSVLIKNEIDNLKGNATQLSKAVKEEIVRLINELKEEFKLIVSNSKTKMKLFIAEFEKIALIISNEKEKFKAFITEIFNDKSSSFIDNITNWIDKKKDEFDDFIQSFNIKKRGIFDESLEEFKKLIPELEDSLVEKINSVKSELDSKLTSLNDEMFKIKTDIEQQITETNSKVTHFETEFSDTKNYLIEELSKAKLDMEDKFKSELMKKIVELKEEYDRKLEDKMTSILIENSTLISTLTSTYNNNIALLGEHIKNVQALLINKQQNLSSDDVQTINDKLNNIMEEIGVIKKTPPQLSTRATDRIAKKIKAKL